MAQTIEKSAKPRATRAKASSPSAFSNRDVEMAIGAFKLASDPTRFRILALLATQEHNVGEICKMMDQAQPAISHHLALLRVSGYIMSRRDGKHNYYGLTESGRKLVAAAKTVVTS